MQGGEGEAGVGACHSKQLKDGMTLMHLQVLVLLTLSIQALPDVIGLVCCRRKGKLWLHEHSHTQVEAVLHT